MNQILYYFYFHFFFAFDSFDCKWEFIMESYTSIIWVFIVVCTLDMSEFQV